MKDWRTTATSLAHALANAVHAQKYPDRNDPALAEAALAEYRATAADPAASEIPDVPLLSRWRAQAMLPCTGLNGPGNICGTCRNCVLAEATDKYLAGKRERRVAVEVCRCTEYGCVRCAGLDESGYDTTHYCEGCAETAAYDPCHVPLEVRRPSVVVFAEAILHGDARHRAWLLEAARCYMAAEKIPAPPQLSELHDDDLAVQVFADAMIAKLAAKRAQGYGGWDDKAACPPGRLATLLNDHLAKGDPVDIGNFAMMLFNRNERTVAPARIIELDTLLRDVWYGIQFDRPELADRIAAVVAGLPKLKSAATPDPAVDLAGARDAFWRTRAQVGGGAPEDQGPLGDPRHGGCVAVDITEAMREASKDAGSFTVTPQPLAPPRPREMAGEPDGGEL